MLEIKLDTTNINKATICFGSEMLLSSTNIVQVLIPTNIANFYIIDKPTLFFLFLKDIDILGIYLNYITNQLICQDSQSIPIIRKCGYS